MERGPYKGSYLWKLMQLDRQLVRDALKSSRTMAEFARNVGLPAEHPSRYGALQRLVIEYELDTSHFVGKAHNKGQPSPLHLTVDEILVEGVKRGRGHLKWALEQLGVPYVCAECRLPPEWNGKELVLPVDHIDGNNLNNRRENLRFLCPNCHTQTETWGNKKRMAL